MLTLTDDTTSPQTVTLSGTGPSPVTLSPTSLAFIDRFLPAGRQRYKFTTKK